MISTAGYQATYEVVKHGAGHKAEETNLVTFHATGVVIETGKQICCTKGSDDKPFLDVAGVQTSAPSYLNPCLLGMQAGEVRKVIMPVYGLGLAPHGLRNLGIPQSGMLEFTIEVLEIKLRYA